MYRRAAPAPADSGEFVGGPMSTEVFVRVCKRLKKAFEQGEETYHQYGGTIRVPEHCRDSFKASGAIVDGERLYGRTSPG